MKTFSINKANNPTKYDIYLMIISKQNNIFALRKCCIWQQKKVNKIKITRTRETYIEIKKKMVKNVPPPRISILK